MGKNVLVVAAVEGFMVRGFETKLKNMEVDSTFTSLAVKDVSAKFGNPDLVVIFTDDEIEKYSDGLVYIKDKCTEKDLQIAVIGAKDDYDILKKYIPESFVFKFFLKPINWDQLMAEMEKYINDEDGRLNRRSILIVDDDVSYMTMIMDWLKDSYRISLANSGMQAITWLANNRPDLILLDYEMPITSGPQVLEMIRSDVQTADIPVMFLTGKGEKDSIMRVLSLKPAGYLLKTIERKDLRENIAGFFAKQMVEQH